MSLSVLVSLANLVTSSVVSFVVIRLSLQIRSANRGQREVNRLHGAMASDIQLPLPELIRLLARAHGFDIHETRIEPLNPADGVVQSRSQLEDGPPLWEVIAAAKSATTH